MRVLPRETCEAVRKGRGEEESEPRATQESAEGVVGGGNEPEDEWKVRRIRKTHPDEGLNRNRVVEWKTMLT